MRKATNEVIIANVSKAEVFDMFVEKLASDTGLSKDTVRDLLSSGWTYVDSNTEKTWHDPAYKIAKQELPNYAISA